MKSKLKIIILAFLGTTAFWCLLIVGFFWWVSADGKSGVSFISEAAQQGYSTLLRAWNDDKKPVIFTVVEVNTNATGTNNSVAVLLERSLPPSGEFWIGIKKKESPSK